MWVESLNEYSFVIKHCSDTENKTFKTLSRVSSILFTLSVKVIGFELLKEEYTQCLDFSCIYQEVQDGNYREYMEFIPKDGYLF